MVKRGLTSFLFPSSEIRTDEKPRGEESAEESTISMSEDPKKYAESIIEVVFNQRRPDRPPVLLKSDSDVIDTSGSGGRKKEMLSFKASNTGKCRHSGIS